MRRTRTTSAAEEWFRQVRDGAEPTVVPSIIQQTFPDYHGVAWY